MTRPTTQPESSADSSPADTPGEPRVLVRAGAQPADPGPCAFCGEPASYTSPTGYTLCASCVAVHHPATRPRDSSATIENASKVLSALVAAAFTDAHNIDNLARRAANAWTDLDAAERVNLSAAHPELAAALVTLEHALYKIDQR